MELCVLLTYLLLYSPSCSLVDSATSAAVEQEQSSPESAVQLQSQLAWFPEALIIKCLGASSSSSSHHSSTGGTGEQTEHPVEEQEQLSTSFSIGKFLFKR